MIILEAQSNATIVGDVQSNAVSVNVNDIDFITTLLSTNLYSRPLESFLREIVSNAWDSHVEAGVKDPILLEIGTDTEGKDYCRIQDFGVGLSPERFNNIYKMMGSSTKRVDNNQIGGFGIGRFSALAYSGTVHLTSNFEGVKYKYLMYKDGNKIKIDELYDTPTTDPNGFEVMVYFKSSSDIHNFKDAIRSQLMYFENLYITADRYDGGYQMHEFAKEFNDLKIKKFKTFSVNTFNDRHTPTLCVGKIRYPLDKYSVPNTHFNFNGDFPIAVNFDIGELSVTPNRENIQYDNNTIAIIEKKLNDVQDEINDLTNLEKVKDYDNLKDYTSKLGNSTIMVTLYKDESRHIFLKVGNTAGKKMTFKGESYNSVIVDMYNYMNHQADFIKVSDFDFMVKDGRLTKINIGRKLSVNQLVDRIGNDEISMCNQSDLNIVAKEYLRDEYQYGEMMFLENNYTWKDVVRRIFNILKIRFYSEGMYSRQDYDSKIAKVIIRDILERLSGLETFTNKSVPQTFIDAREAAKKERRQKGSNDSINWSEELNLFVLKESNRYNDETRTAVTSDSTRVPLSTLKSEWNKFPVIYSYKGCPILRDLYWVFSKTPNNSYRKYVFVEIAPTKISNLEQFPNFINIIDYMDIKYKKIRAIATAQHIKQTYPHLETLYNVNYQIEKISKPLFDAIDKAHTYVVENSMRSYYHGAPEILKEILNMCNEHNYHDEEMMGFINENDTLLTNCSFLTLFTINSRLDERVHNIAVDYALTKKLFRPNVEAVKKLREETIFNIKKEENEIN